MSNTTSTSTPSRDHSARDGKRTPEGRRAAKAATIARKAARAAKRQSNGGAK